MNFLSPQANPGINIDKLSFDPTQKAGVTPTNPFLGKIDEEEFNQDYENALKVNMMTRMKSHMVQKMNDTVEQERALMVEQQTFD